MRTTLQAKILRSLSFLFAIFLVCSMAVLHAQVLLQDDSAIDIRFTTGPSNFTPTTLLYTLQDISLIIGESLNFQSTDWSDIAISQSSKAGYYLQREGQHVAAGTLNIEGLEAEGQSFFGLSLKNDSDYNFTEIFAAFDMEYNKQDFINHYNLGLKYRVNNSEWQLINSAGFSTNNLDAGEDAWNSLSIQLNIDDLFLRNGDEIDLLWFFEDANIVDEIVPLLMSSIEVEPRKSSERTIERGSVIITEIMPAFSFEGQRFEYIELYNPANEPLNLRGIEIRSSSGSHVIQRDVIIEPYEILVLSNVDISDLPTVNNIYIYRDSLIPSGGRIEFVFNSSVLASTTYNNTEPGIALYLDSAVNAFDGYTSMRNLQPSDQIIYGEIMGSPGQLSGTIGLYRNTITEPGWHLIRVPGYINSRLSRNQNVTLFEMNGERIQAEDIVPFQPVFLHKPDRSAVTIFAEEDVRYRQESTAPSENFVFPELNIIAPTRWESMFLNSPMKTVWDVRRGEFLSQFSDEIADDKWIPFFVNTSEYRSSSNVSARNHLIFDRYIPISLSEGSRNQKRQLDTAILGFIEQPSTGEVIRYDLPKLSTTLPLMEPDNSNKLFLGSEKAVHRTNSFLHLPYNINESYRVGIGTDLVMQSANMFLEWSIPEAVPDEWIITLEDRQTGTLTNMREENSYRFRSTGREQHIFDGREIVQTEVSVYQSDEGYRFNILIEPFETITEKEEALDTPGSIELRPNYPNPFNPSTNISFYLPEERPVRLGIYNIVGQQVALLMDDTIQPGEHSVVWNAANNPSGIYIVQLETGNRTLTRKITLIK
ncbi:MAG: T9SS C-terminal target domain-containing protein [Balneolaceae bacterium]|nr:MAG: T9SS C-terminal target domain-containing protein [Balneolaceae bacterium]